MYLDMIEIGWVTFSFCAKCSFFFFCLPGTARGQCEIEIEFIKKKTLIQDLVEVSHPCIAPVCWNL